MLETCDQTLEALQSFQRLHPRHVVDVIEVRNILSKLKIGCTDVRYIRRVVCLYLANLVPTFLG